MVQIGMNRCDCLNVRTVGEVGPKNWCKIACNVTIKMDPQEGPMRKNRSMVSMNWYKLTFETY